LNEAGSIIELQAKSPSAGAIRFSARVLYWWEIQDIKSASIVVDRITSQSFLDASRLHGMMVDAFMESITDGDTTARRADLDPGVTWRQRLHPTIIRPIFDAYNEACNPTTEELNVFREQVRGYFDPSLRRRGIYVVPSEIWEMVILSRMGGISLSEVRKLSYTEMRKLLIIVDFMDGRPVTPSTDDESADRFAGMIPSQLLGNPDLTTGEVLSAMSPEGARA